MKETSVEMFKCDKLTTCCFTGHRNRDLPFNGDLHKQGMKCLVSTLHMLVEEAIEAGYTTFISGMAEGIDLYCAEIIRQMKVSGRQENLKLVCALPYREQYGEMGSQYDKYLYSVLIQGCDEKVIISEKKDPGRYKRRNSFMVEHSSRIIGAIKEKSNGSGTLQTLNMAKRKGLEMRVIFIDRNPQLFLDIDEKYGSIDNPKVLKEKNFPL